MNTFINRLVWVSMLMVSAQVHSAVQRDPIGVNVAADRAVSVSVRFADSNGTAFTTDQALFCYRQLANGQCDPSAILGRLPASRDRGSTSTPVSSISDVMTIPYSVIRSTVVRAQTLDFSDFYYVRRFRPAPGEDLGAGVDQPVYQKVTCHLAGPATVPLSLTKVSIYGQEPFRNEKVKLIRLSQDNLEPGRLYAGVEHTGTGVIEGWWEVRRPGDPELKAIDLLPQAALSAEERGRQSRFFRVKRFRVKATSAGHVLIEGPAYHELPRDISGRHDVLLRFSAGRGRENRARLAVAGEPLNLFSGAIAGFRIPPIEYHVPVDLTVNNSVYTLAPHLQQTDSTGSNAAWHLVWQMQPGNGTIIKLTTPQDGGKTIIAKASTGVLELPYSWDVTPHAGDMRVVLLGPDGLAVSKEQSVLITN